MFVQLKIISETFTVETLNDQVSTAIYIAEQLEDARDPSAPAAFRIVSELEEQLTWLIPAGDCEGKIARRGAVRAAMNAGELERARLLVQRFLGDAASDQELIDQLKAILSSQE